MRANYPISAKRRHEGVNVLLQTIAHIVPQLGAALVRLDLTPYQLHRLDEGLLGVTNELKAYEMARRRSAVPGFADTLAWYRQEGWLPPRRRTDRSRTHATPRAET